MGHAEDLSDTCSKLVMNVSCGTSLFQYVLSARFMSCGSGYETFCRITLLRILLSSCISWMHLNMTPLIMYVLICTVRYSLPSPRLKPQPFVLCCDATNNRQHHLAANCGVCGYYHLLQTPLFTTQHHLHHRQKQHQHHQTATTSISPRAPPPRLPA